MSIEWRSEMSIDGGVIDADHRCLFKIINKFEKKTGKFLTVYEAEEILFELKNYTLRHFSREESLQKSANFPDHETHQKYHDLLVRQLDEMIGMAQRTNKNSVNKLALKISKFLNHWLLDHILNADFKMKSCVNLMKLERNNFQPLADLAHDFGHDSLACKRDEQKPAPATAALVH